MKAVRFSMLLVLIVALALLAQLALATPLMRTVSAGIYDDGDLTTSSAS
jgi:hypothetical protein